MQKREQLLEKFQQESTNFLVLSLCIDLVGMLSYIGFMPTELTDIISAPVLGYAIYMLHGTKTGAIVGFAEELLPFTDVIPTATIIWYLKYVKNKEQTLQQLEQGTKTIEEINV